MGGQTREIRVSSHVVANIFTVILKEDYQNKVNQVDQDVTLQKKISVATSNTSRLCSSTQAELSTLEVFVKT